MPEPTTMPEPAVERIAYSPAEAARALGISRGLVYKMMNDGRLRCFKIGVTTKIPAADVHALADPANTARK